MKKNKPPPKTATLSSQTNFPVESSNQSLPQNLHRRMIVINNKLAKEILANAIASGRVSSGSSPQAYLLQSLVHLNFTFEVRKDAGLIIPKDMTLDAWSSTEIAAAETINWLIAFLEKLNCASIEQLLRDVADYRSRHPDYPQGQWPYVKGPK